MAAVQPRTRPRVNTAPTSRLKLAAPTGSNHDGLDGAKANSSPLSVSLRNLRLLDLDLLPDWPDVAAETFATTGVQGQKKRIQCVEWILVKLFGIWDPEATSSKLSPFFPPHDQMQSVNLRSALLRALETVKRNGFLGRDSVIRKTMLDDCKGERLEEVLAYFSTAVLKKVVEEEVNTTGRRPPMSLILAFENRGYDSDNTDLYTLNLAYRVSLRRFLEQKEDMRAMYRDFDDLLSIKERGISRRREAVRAKEADSSRDTLSNNAREEMHRLVRNNWSGNEKWMKVLVKGENNVPGAGLFGMPFDRVWRRVQQGRLSEVEEDSSSLLDQLDSRVRLQKERLAKWDSFRKTAFGQGAEASASPSTKREAKKKPKRGIDFRFSAHQDLHMGAVTQSLGTSHEKEMGLSEEHGELLRGLKEELADIKGPNTAIVDFLTRTEPRRRRFGDSLSQSTDGGDAISEMSELEDEIATAPITVRTNRTKLESLTRQPLKPALATLEVFTQSTSTQQSSLSPPHDEKAKGGLDKPPIYTPPPDDLDDIEPPPSPTQNTANDILEAMANASPSPVNRPKQRPTLSLAQRTRLSMAGTRSPFLDEEPELPNRPLPREPAAAPAPPLEPESLQRDGEVMDLVGRTRLSMAGFEKAQKKAQLERRKSLRRSKVLPRREGSYFPRVEEEEDGGDREALRAELMMGEDVEAVFKSRPKMRTSPVGSPGGEW